MGRTTTTELYTWVDVLYHQCESLALHLIGTDRLNALHLVVCISWGLKVSRLFCFCCRFHVQGTALTPNPSSFERVRGPLGVSLTPLAGTHVGCAADRPQIPLRCLLLCNTWSCSWMPITSSNPTGGEDGGRSGGTVRCKLETHRCDCIADNSVSVL